jgi:hypothetical protein
MSKLGVETLYRALISGREGITLRQVDENGEFVVLPDGRAAEQSSSWLRTEVVPIENGSKAPVPPELTPEQKLARLRTQFGQDVEGLDNGVRQIQDLRSEDG